jgi:hypothetical protein
MHISFNECVREAIHCYTLIELVLFETSGMSEKCLLPPEPNLTYFIVTFVVNPAWAIFNGVLIDCSSNTDGLCKMQLTQNDRCTGAHFPGYDTHSLLLTHEDVAEMVLRLAMLLDVYPLVAPSLPIHHVDEPLDIHQYPSGYPSRDDHLWLCREDHVRRALHPTNVSNQ